MASEWDAAGYVTSSKYRRGVVEHLHEHGSAIPSEIAAATEHALPHVSRALGQLREQGLVELLVPEERRRGRLYGLTKLGATAVERLAREGRPGEYEVVPVERFNHPDMIRFLEEEVGDALRAVACVSDGLVEITFLSQRVRDNYSGTQLENLLSDLEVLWRQAGSGQVRDALGDHRYMVHVFDQAIVLCLFCPGQDVVVSTDPTLDMPVSAVAEACLDKLEN